MLTEPPIMLSNPSQQKGTSLTVKLVLFWLILSTLSAVDSAVVRRARLQQRRERLLLVDGLRDPRFGSWGIANGELAGRISGLRPAAQVFR
jgi:hypothetical protein